MHSVIDTEASPHQPVLLHEAIAHLAPRPSGVYCDATVGYAGHARAILEASRPDGRLIGLDRDPNAIAAARQQLAEFGDRVALYHAPFSELRDVLARANVPPLDGCIADLGVSSPQLDRGERGFSFRREGPLDMRMDPTRGETAAELLRRIDEEELEGILRDLGEERFARRIARAIVEARDRGEAPDTTAALSALVARNMPRHERHKDPATRTFQALRIAVNAELDELAKLLDDAPSTLAPGGRLVIITFHSLEDRMVKHRFRALASQSPETRGQPPTLRLLTKRPLVAADDETARNPRARSAKLRAAEKVAA